MHWLPRMRSFLPGLRSVPQMALGTGQSADGFSYKGRHLLDSGLGNISGKDTPVKCTEVPLMPSLREQTISQPNR